MNISRFSRAMRVSSPTFFVLGSLLVLGGAFAWTPAAKAEDTHEVKISIKDHKFDPPSLKLPIGKPIKILVKNLDATPEEFESHDLGFEKVIAGNSSAIIRVKPLKPGTYVFFGEFHKDTALGHVVAE